MAISEKPASSAISGFDYYAPLPNDNAAHREPPSAIQRWSRRALAILIPICLLLAITGHRPTYPWVRPCWWRQGRHGHHFPSPPSSSSSSSSLPSNLFSATTDSSASALAKVPLEAHIMSKCPDARDCLRELVVPAMAQIADKVDFTLSYIGIPVEGFGIECLHGQEECLGNIILLCAAEAYPDPKLYLGFAMCMTNHYPQIPQPELIKGCALEHGIEFNALNECASRDDLAHGYHLLNASVARTRAAHVTRSCTVRLNNEIRCIRDGGQWTDCPGGHNVTDLVRDINNLAQADS